MLKFMLYTCIYLVIITTLSSKFQFNVCTFHCLTSLQQAFEYFRVYIYICIFQVCANVGVAHCVCAAVRSYAVPCARVALVARIPGSVASRGLVILCGKFTVRFHATFPLGQPLFLLVDRITLLAHVAFVTSVLSVTSNDFFFSRLQVLSQSTTNFFVGRK